MLQEITDEMYAQVTASGVVVVDFRQDFCSPCRAMDTILTTVAQDPQMKKRVKFVTLTVNREPLVAAAIGVTHVPTVLIKKDGQIVDHLTEIRSPQVVKQMLQQYLPTEVTQ